MNEMVTSTVYVAQLSPDDGFTDGSGAPDDAVTRIYSGASVKFGGSKKQD